MLWSGARSPSYSDVFGPLVASHVETQIDMDSHNARTFQWLWPALRALRPEQRHDIALNENCVVQCPVYVEFLERLVEPHNEFVAEVLLANGAELFIACALKTALRAVAIRRVFDMKEDAPLCTNIIAETTAAVMTDFSRRTAEIWPDVKTLLHVSFSANAAKLNALLPMDPAPGSDTGGESPDESANVSPPADDVKDAGSAALQTMRKAFRSKIRLRFAGDALIHNAMIVALLSRNPEVDLPTILSPLKALFEPDAPSRLVNARQRILEARAELRNPANDEMWIALACAVSSWASDSQPAVGFDSQIDDICTMAERGPDSTRPWTLKQALAAFILSQHPSPQSIWTGPFELGRMRLSFRTALQDKKSLNDGPTMPAHLLKKVIKELE